MRYGYVPVGFFGEWTFYSLGDSKNRVRIRRSLYDTKLCGVLAKGLLNISFLRTLYNAIRKR